MKFIYWCIFIGRKIFSLLLNIFKKIKYSAKSLDGIVQCFYCLSSSDQAKFKWLKFDERLLIRNEKGEIYGLLPLLDSSIVPCCKECLKRLK